SFGRKIRLNSHETNLGSIISITHSGSSTTARTILKSAFRAFHNQSDDILVKHIEYTIFIHGTSASLGRNQQTPQHPFMPARTHPNISLPVSRRSTQLP
ncbi:hypothetical protein WG66_003160, partial [Moniliophthora roreri]